MNSFASIEFGSYNECPWCEGKDLKIKIDNQIISFKCECGFLKTMWVSKKYKKIL